MALKFGKTEGEIWMERLTAGLISGVILVAHLVIFALLAKNVDHKLDAVLAPLLCWIAWQSISKAATGAAFSVRFLTDEKTAREVYDISFTSLCFLNVCFFWYFVFGW